MQAYSISRAAAVCWSAALTLLSFLCLTHLGVLLCFAFGAEVSPWAAPLALAGALMTGYGAARWQGLSGRMVWLPSLIFLAVFICALGISAAFYDMSWDGLWYHQTAIYQMEKGWNPVREPIRELPSHLKTYVLHYAKGSWYVATAIYKTTGHIEWGKCGQWITFAAMFLSVLAAGLEAEIGNVRAGMLAVLVSLNPVVTCQLYSFYVDGLMIACLACYTAAFIAWMRRPSACTAIVGVIAAILCINVKFTGLVFLCFVMAGFGLYSLLGNRTRLFKYVFVSLAPLLLGVFVWGYNPYVTNTLHRGSPFYPLYGNEEHPGWNRTGEDPIERWETPSNMKGRPRAVRYGYAIFGHPLLQLEGEVDAELMVPFTPTFKEMGLYHFHEQRIAGFGPYFSGVLILSLALMGGLLFVPGAGRWTALLGVAVLVVSLSISKHEWWARYGPQLWWVPIIPVCSVFLYVRKGWIARIAWGISGLLFVNALIVAGVHLHWEVCSTRTVKQQMASLAGNGTYEFDFKWFGEPFGERLKTAGVAFHTLPEHSLKKEHGRPMLSVCEGYPGTILYRPVAERSEQ